MSEVTLFLTVCVILWGLVYHQRALENHRDETEKLENRVWQLEQFRNRKEPVQFDEYDH